MRKKQTNIISFIKSPIKDGEFDQLHIVILNTPETPGTAWSHIIYGR